MMASSKTPIGERLFPTTHDTLGKIRDAGLQLYGYCLNEECRWGSVVDLDRIIGKLGAEHSAMQPLLVPKLHCPKCGSKDIAIQLSAAEVVPEASGDHLRNARKIREI